MAEPRSKPPIAVEKAHAVRVRRYVTELERWSAPRLRAAIAELYPNPTRSDSAHVDDGFAIVDRVLGAMRLRWLTEIATEERIAEDCGKAGRQLDLFETAWARKTLASVAVQGWTPGGKVERLMPFWVQEHTDLISRGGTWRGKVIDPLGDKMIGEIGDVVREGFATGARHEQLAKQIRERFNVGRSRATLIARDQTNKLNGQLMKEDFAAAGLTAYIWRTSRDERVRPTHAALEGQTILWSTPPPEGHPGAPIQCRCTPAPVRALGQPRTP